MPDDAGGGSGRVLGVDLGEVRVGLAISDPGRTVATPLETVAVERGSDPQLLAATLAEAAADRGVGLVVVGLPRDLSGRESAPAHRARAVAASLRERGVEVELWDERFTTVEAERAMIEQGARRRERRQAVDRVAATLLLQSFLDAHR